jgi:inosine/xanthosine triphosphate pyrophosphatase family protein
MRKIALATQNSDDAAALQEALKGLNISVLTMGQIGIKGEPDESGGTLAENASNKAQYVGKFSHGWAIAIALASEVAGESMSAAVDRLKRLPAQARWSTFQAAIVIVNFLGEEWSCEGEMRGTVIHDSVLVSYHGPLINKVRDLLTELFSS